MKIDKVASVADVILGLWLVVSMFFWRHSPEHMANAGAIGVLSIGFGALAHRGQTWARWLVAPLGVWLVLSLWALPDGTVPMVVNHFLVGTLLFGFSALPSGRGKATGEYPL